MTSWKKENIKKERVRKKMLKKVKGFFKGLAKSFDSDIKKEVYLPVQQGNKTSKKAKKSYPRETLKNTKQKTVFVAHKLKYNQRKVISR